MGSRAEALAELKAGPSTVRAFAREHPGFLPAAMLERFIQLARAYQEDDGTVPELAQVRTIQLLPQKTDIGIALYEAFAAAFECAPAIVLDPRLRAIASLLDVTSLTYATNADIGNAVRFMFIAASKSARTQVLRAQLRYEIHRESLATLLLRFPGVHPESETAFLRDLLTEEVSD